MDIGEHYSAKLLESQQRRGRHRRNSARLLKEKEIPFESHSVHADGSAVHLVVDGRIDFWPGTGKWIDREDKKKGTGRGVKALILYYQEL